jgi:hypothetical protein
MAGTTLAAQDDLPERCGDAQVLSPGQYSGVIDSPDDDDVFKYRVQKGDYTTFSAVVPQEQGGFEITVSGDRNNIDINSANLKNVSGGDEDLRSVEVDNFAPGVEGSWRVYPEDDGVVCIYIDDEAEIEEKDTPYEWQISFERNDPDPAGFEITEVRAENDALRSEVSELESQVSELESQVSELESQIDDKDQRIAELEMQTTDVTIDVRVESAGQASISAGGEMVVDVSSQGAEASAVSIGFAGEQYTPTGGDVVIPLQDAGQQQLSVEYEDTVETVPIEVQSQNTTANTGDNPATNTT